MKPKQSIFQLVLLITSIISFAQGNKPTGDKFSIAHPTKQFNLKSSYGNGREYKMHITYAMDSLAVNKKYPVLYYTDAWAFIDWFNQLGYNLTLTKEIEPVILVGISFVANDEAFVKLRREDFYPNLINPDSTNGAKDFLNFLKEELIPYMEKNYPADSNDRGLFGFSSGGLFATYVLKEEPTLFKRFAIVSPSFLNNNSLLLKDQVLSDNIKNARDLKIFVSYGSLESERTKANIETIFSLLNANKNIQSAKFVLEGGHYSALPTACTKTFTYLYERKK